MQRKSLLHLKAGRRKFLTHARLKMHFSRDCVVSGFGGAGRRAGEDVAHNLLLTILPIHRAALTLLGYPGILWVTSTDPMTHIHPRCSY